MCGRGDFQGTFSQCSECSERDERGPERDSICSCYGLAREELLMGKTNDVNPTVASLWVAQDLVLCRRMVVALAYPGEWQLAQAGMFMRLVKDGISFTNISVACREEWQPAPC